MNSPIYSKKLNFSKNPSMIAVTIKGKAVNITDIINRIPVSLNKTLLHFGHLYGFCSRILSIPLNTKCQKDRSLEQFEHLLLGILISFIFFKSL